MSREADLVEALEKISSHETKCIMPWTHEIAADTYSADLDRLRCVAREALVRYRASAEGGDNEWRDPATAPKNDTLLELLVDYSADGADHPLEDDSVAATIGFNSFDSDGVDEWKFAGWCWTHDHFVQGKGKVIGWRPSRLKQEPRP